MRKPTAKMIEALVDLFSHNGGYVTHLPGITVSTWAGLVERELVTPGPRHALTDAGLAFLVDTRRAVVAPDGSHICGNREPLTGDQVTAELIRFESDRALDAAALAKADAIRARRAVAALPIGAPVRRKLDDARGVVVAHHGPTVEVALVGADGTVAGAPSAFELDTEERCDSPEHDAAACDTCRTEASERVSTGLVDATAMMLTEGRGSAITNFPNGSHAWTPVDRESEFDQAARRAPESAWERPTTYQGTPCVRCGHLRNTHDAVKWAHPCTACECDGFSANPTPGSVWQDAAEMTEAPKPTAVGFLPAIDQALTPGEIALLDGVTTPEVNAGDWLASVNGSNRVALRFLVDRGLAYLSNHSVHLHHYVTEVGAMLIRYRRALAAAKDSATPERVHSHIARTFGGQSLAQNHGVMVPLGDAQHASDLTKVTGASAVTIEQVRDGQVISSTTQAARELISGGLNATLTIQRLRRGLALTQADRTALADLLDTVRGQLGLNNADTAWFNVSNRFIEHFGDPR